MSEPELPRSRSLSSLAELGLSDEELAEWAVVSAEGGIAALEASGLEPTEALRRRAAGDPELVAAYVTQYSTSRTNSVQ